MEEIHKVYEKVHSGIFSIYCKKENKIFHVFYARKNICLTAGLKEGIPLQELPFFSFLSSMDENTNRRVRREDFIHLIKLIRDKMNNVKLSYFISLLTGGIILNVQQASNNIAFFFRLILRKKNCFVLERISIFF